MHLMEIDRFGLPVHHRQLLQPEPIKQGLAHRFSQGRSPNRPIRLDQGFLQQKGAKRRRGGGGLKGIRMAFQRVLVEVEATSFGKKRMGRPAHQRHQSLPQWFGQGLGLLGAGLIGFRHGHCKAEQQSGAQQQVNSMPATRLGPEGPQTTAGGGQPLTGRRQNPPARLAWFPDHAQGRMTDL